MSEGLLCYLYLYLVMGAIFFVGLIFTIKQGDVGLKSRRTRRNALVLVGGFVLYAIGHGFFQFVASGW